LVSSLSIVGLGLLGRDVTRFDGRRTIGLTWSQDDRRKPPCLRLWIAAACSAAAASVAAMSALPNLRARAAGNDIVDTNSGKIRGIDSDGIWSFKGVPYRRVDRRATASCRRRSRSRGRACANRDRVDRPGAAAKTGPRRPEHAELSGKPTGRRDRGLPDPESWTPGTSGRRPVMVWYHGGAVLLRLANGDRLMGAKLARRDDVWS